MEAARGLILWFWGYVMQVTAEVDYQVPSMAGEAARGPIGGDRANRGGLSRDADSARHTLGGKAPT